MNTVGAVSFVIHGRDDSHLTSLMEGPIAGGASVLFFFFVYITGLTTFTIRTQPFKSVNEFHYKRRVDASGVIIFFAFAATQKFIFLSDFVASSVGTDQVEASFRGSFIIKYRIFNWSRSVCYLKIYFYIILINF